jgi:hypothetical protein
MKETISIFLLMCIVAVATSCTSSKHGCKGLSAHPNFKKSWTKH